jgi:signal transduction histidine kinase
MKRLVVTLSLLALGLAVPVAVLVARALESAASEDDDRHRLLAERVFDEMEEALSRFLETEEARHFEAYGFYEELVLGEAGQVTHSRVSPLARPPERAFVLGHFQVDPDGSLHTPRRPREREVAIALRQAEFRPSVEVDSLEILLRGAWERAALQSHRAPAGPGLGVGTTSARGAVASKRDLAEGFAPAPALAPEPEADLSKLETRERTSQDLDAYDAVLRSLNQAGERRAERKQKVQELQSDLQAATSLATQRPPALESEPPLALAPRQARAHPPTPEPNAPGHLDVPPPPPATPKLRAADAAAEPAAPLASAGPDPKPLVIALDPMVGRVTAASSHLLLYRTVLVGEQGYRQGLLVDWRRMGEWLDARVLEPSGLAGAGRTTWFAVASEPAPSATHPYVFRHRFAEPFDSLGVELGLPRLPGGRGTGTIHALWVLLAIVAAAGLGAVYRMTSVVVQFAERRSRFAASISHELKTPLTSIRMYGEMLRDGLVANEAKRDEYYRTISDESERLSRLIDNVLDFSRLERGEYELRRERGGVLPALEGAARKLRPHVERHGFTLRLEVGRGLPAVEFDRDALTQVVFNLVDNALKYAAGAARKEIELAVRRSTDADGIEISLRDFGPGVPPRELARVFEPFYRGEDELTRTTKGTGIGLALVRELVDSLGGRVEAANVGPRSGRHPGARTDEVGDGGAGGVADERGDERADEGSGFRVSIFLPACKL